MKLVTNFPVYNSCTDPYGSMAGVAQDCAELGLDGLEIIWDHMPYTEELPPEELVIGYHLLFFSCWADFWLGNQDFLDREYGDEELVREYYHGLTQDEMVAHYRQDLQRAIDFNAEYVVFHVSEVSLEECFTYQFAHSDKEIIDASIDLVNRIFDGIDTDAALLVENLWWPGFTFTDPAMTKRLLDGIEHDNKGIMLDTGHLLHTNTSLRNQAEAAKYVGEMFDAHKELGEMVRGLHLQQSVTGAYVEERGFDLPDDFTGDYWNKFTVCYNHVVQIDRHQPWTEPAIADVIKRIDPEWINNELSSYPREAHDEAIATQLDTLRRGGLFD